MPICCHEPYEQGIKSITLQIAILILILMDLDDYAIFPGIASLNAQVQT